MYRVVRFDKFAFARQFFAILILSAVVTAVGRTISEPQWVKEGENFVLFFVVLVGTLLYGFSVATVFQAGQQAWNAIIEAVNNRDNESVRQLQGKQPDFFPTLLVILGWTLLSLASMFLQIPRQMDFLMFVLNIVITTPVFLAFDYWGYKSGIKRIEWI